MSGEPLPDLTMLASLLEPKRFGALIAKAQRTAWLEYGQTELPKRFGVKRHPNDFGFSQRSAAYMQRRSMASAAARQRARVAGRKAYNANEGKVKGDLPDYVYTGAGMAAVMKRKPKTTRSAGAVSTKRSIWLNALNALKDKRGWQAQREVVERSVVTRTAHVRSGPRGPVSVRSYQQRATRYKWSGQPASRTYKEEWAFRPGEIVAVSRRSDELLRDALRSIGYNKKSGTLKAKFRSRLAARDAEFNAAMFDGEAA